MKPFTLLSEDGVKTQKWLIENFIRSHTADYRNVTNLLIR